MTDDRTLLLLAHVMYTQRRFDEADRFLGELEAVGRPLPPIWKARRAAWRRHQGWRPAARD